MNNIIFCTDKNYFCYLQYIFNTFKKFNDLKKYLFYFVLYDDNQNIHIELEKILNNISPEIKFKYNYFVPTDNFINSLKNYLSNISNKDISSKASIVFKNYGNWSRFFIHNLFPEIKIGLYLDLDILFCSNIDELFKLNLDNYEIAVSPTIQCNFKYKSISQLINFDNGCDINNLLIDLDINFDKLKDVYSYNCGVVLYNFDNYKKINIENKLIKYFNYKERFHKPSGTQCIFNLLFPNYFSLENKYNIIMKYIRYYESKKSSKKRKIKSIYKNMSFDNKCILHFKGIELNDRFKNIYNKIME